MWEKKKEEPRPAAPPLTSQPQAAQPPRPVVPPAAPPSSSTTIGKSMTIVGEIRSSEDLYLDGDVQGSVLVVDHRLTIGPNGKIQSNIKAREVTVMGKVKGDVEAGQKVMIRKNGELIGNIKTTGITIDDEAYFKGSIDIVRPDHKN
jgi:cytoskeletal protein CcmA (bactofilin family)